MTVVRVCDCRNYVYVGEEIAKANARLIAAAPELLEACHEALHALTLSEVCQDEIDAASAKIEAAIAKAEGRES